MKEYHLRITTPAGNVFDGEAVRLSVRGVMGDLAIMAGHIPFVTALKDGEIKVHLSNDNIIKMECSGGVLTVSKDMVQLLAANIEKEIV